MTDTDARPDDREDRVETLFHDALDLPPSERAAWLDEACAGDVALRDEVADLLAAHGGAPSAFDAPAWGIADRVAAADQVSLLGTSVGPYAIEAVLGEGGMGTVYLAEQREPLRRRVALKVIKAGMDTAEVVARFDAERRALASLNHPSIAAVHDAGTTERGRPYFVMEYVDGRRITDDCDARRLSLAERVRVFVRVCEAVHHAHGQGIVHRDLKPSNVLVTEVDGEPVPKVIDFGVAKATGARDGGGTVFTRLGQLVGTPEYMSPEQALDPAGGVDARSDVYSLGVLLYRLLSGLLPLDLRDVRGASETTVRAFFSEAEVPLASARFGALRRSAGRIATQRRTTPKRLRGDLAGPLDWILAKALEHDRSKRYATVSDLTADLRAYLLGEPLMARRPSLAARVGRGLRRRRREAVAAACVASAVGLGALLSDQLAAPEPASVETVRERLAAAPDAPWLVPGRVAIRNDVGEPLVAGEVVALELLDASGPVPLLSARCLARPSDAVPAVVAGALGALDLDGDAPVLADAWGVAVLHGVATTRVTDGPVRAGDLLAVDASSGLRVANDARAAPVARALADASAGQPVAALVFGAGLTAAPRAPELESHDASAPVSRVEVLRETRRVGRGAFEASAPNASSADVVAALAAFERRLARLEVRPLDVPVTHAADVPIVSALFGAPTAGAPVTAVGAHATSAPGSHDEAMTDDGTHASGGATRDDDAPTWTGDGPHGVDGAAGESSFEDTFGKKGAGTNDGAALDTAPVDGAQTSTMAQGDVGDAWADIDRDGRLDVLVHGPDVPWALLRNSGSRFDDVTDASGLGLLVDVIDAWWRDVDGDTRPDLVALRSDGSLGAWRNLGATTFVDVTAWTQLDALTDVTDVEWIDVDGDERPDLRATSVGGGLCVGLNDGAGRFDVFVLRAPVPEDGGPGGAPKVGKPGDGPPPGGSDGPGGLQQTPN